MLISILENQKPKVTKTRNSNKGFTLIEILVALGLVALLMGILVTGGFTPRPVKEEVTSFFERSFVASQDESTLRNSIVRIFIQYDEDQSKVSVQSANDSGTVLPKDIFLNSENLTISEREKLFKKRKKLNRSFSRIEEFSDSDYEFPYGAKLIGVGNLSQDTISVEEDFGIYFYPTGEKDAVFIAFAYEQDLVTITTEAYTNRVTTSYHKLAGDIRDMELETAVEQAQELFSKWKERK